MLNRSKKAILFTSLMTAIILWWFLKTRDTSKISRTHEDREGEDDEEGLAEIYNLEGIQAQLNLHESSKAQPSYPYSILEGSEWFRDPKYKLNPLEYHPKRLTKPIGILFFSDIEDTYVRTDTFFYETYEAAQRHPSILPHFWGPGFAGYDRNKTWNENILTKWACGQFQILFTHYGLSDIWDELPTTEPLLCDTLLVVKGGDCNLGQCVRDTYLLNGNITLVRYANEVLEMYSYSNIVKERNIKYSYLGEEAIRNKFQFHLFGHVPDTANEWDFYPVADWTKKKHDAMLFGKVNEYYPLRTTVAKAIKTNQTFIVEPPPMSNSIGQDSERRKKRPVPHTLDWSDASHDSQRKILKDFSANMRNSKICVFDGSVEQKFIRKFSQAMLSGCVIAGDLPADHDEVLRGNIIQLNLDATIEEINQVIREALKDEKELQRRANRLLEYARQHLTSTRELDLVIEISNRYRDGQRGYWFPTGFSAICRHYSSSDADLVPPWCNGKDFKIRNEIL